MNANNFENLSAENSIDSLAQVRPEEIYGAITGQFFQSILAKRKVRINWDYLDEDTKTYAVEDCKTGEILFESSSLESCKNYSFDKDFEIAKVIA